MDEADMRSSLLLLFPPFLIAAPACTRPLAVRPEPEAAASSRSAPAPETPLTSLAPHLRAKAEMAMALCEARTLVTTEVYVGCASRPPFLTTAQKGDGKLRSFDGQDANRFCGIDAIYAGSFSRPGADEAIVAFSGCKENGPNGDDTWDMGNAGSALLVRREASRWREVGFVDHVNASSCRIARRKSGRQALLCVSSFGAGTGGSISYVFQLDFPSGDGDGRALTLVMLFSDPTRCQWTSSSAVAASGLTMGSVHTTALEDLNGDGADDLVVTASHTHVAPSAAFAAKAEAWCKKNAEGDLIDLVPPQHKVQLELLAQDERYGATSATRRLLDKWTAESPKEMMGLPQAAPPMDSP
jgi:hypothetical protein